MAQTETKYVMVLNAGSSSLKYQLLRCIDANNVEDEPIVKGLHEKIGEKDSNIKDHLQAVNMVLQELQEKGIDVSKIIACGHRVVHGGKYTESEVIDQKVRAEIDRAKLMAPLHNGGALNGIDAGLAGFKVPHVAVFDTSFHMTMPAEAYLYAIPYHYYKEHSIRKYGFHGTSYKYVLNQVAQELNKPVEQTNCVIMHIGNGASVVCVKNGKCIDTSMGVGPLEGVAMGTRSGDIDPTVIQVINRIQSDLTIQEIDTILNKKSGLLGLAGVNDVRTIFERMNETGEDAERAKLAMGVYVHKVRKYLGAYVSYLGFKPDAIVFTAGVGENATEFRRMVLEGYDEICPIDKELNKKKFENVLNFSAQQDQKCKALVIRTNEEKQIALECLKLTQ